MSKVSLLPAWRMKTASGLPGPRLEVSQWRMGCAIAKLPNGAGRPEAVFIGHTGNSDTLLIGGTAVIRKEEIEIPVIAVWNHAQNHRARRQRIRCAHHSSDIHRTSG